MKDIYKHKRVRNFIGELEQSLGPVVRPLRCVHLFVDRPIRGIDRTVNIGAMLQLSLYVRIPTASMVDSSIIIYAFISIFTAIPQV